MKFVIVAALALVAVVSCAPAQSEVEIVRSSYDQQPQGSYNFDFETSDGTKRNEDGELKVVQDEENEPREVVVVRGTYAYVDPEGNPQFINYYADETGFHAEGDSIPKDGPARR